MCCLVFQIYVLAYILLKNITMVLLLGHESVCSLQNLKPLYDPLLSWSLCSCE
jgi:hypothetical protein